MNNEETLKKIVEYLKTKPDVACGYLFGSFGTEDFREGISDLDIGLIQKNNPEGEPYKYFMDIERITWDLEALLKISVDVVEIHFLRKDIACDLFFRNECIYGEDSEERMDAIAEFDYWAEENYRLMCMLDFERSRYLAGYYDEDLDEEGLINNGKTKQ